MKDLFRYIFLSSDPGNEELKELVYHCFYMPWLTGDFLPELLWLIPARRLEKPNGGLCGIGPVDIWSRGGGHAIVQAVAVQALAEAKLPFISVLCDPTFGGNLQ